MRIIYLMTMVVISSVSCRGIDTRLEKKQDTIVVIVDKQIDSIEYKNIENDSLFTVVIKGNYFNNKKDNEEFARIYFNQLENEDILAKKYNEIFKKCRVKLIASREIANIDDADELFSLFPHPSPILDTRKNIKVYVFLKEEWQKKECVTLFPVKFGANEIEY